MHLRNWKAKRAGGRITVNGIDHNGKPAKLVGVDEIVPAHGGCTARDKNGDEHFLAI